MPKNDFLTGGYSCDYCGKSVGNTNYHNGGFIVKEQFCSPKCQMKWNELNVRSQSGNERSRNDEATSSSEREMTEEEISEMAERRRIKEQEEREALERDREKAADLKEEGKKWLSYWYYIGINGRIGFGIGTGMAIMAGAGAYVSVQDGTLPLAVPIVLMLIGLVGIVFGVLVLKDFILRLFNK
jgi:hypothetical protein